MNAEVFKKENILFDETSTTQTEAFKEIANFAKERGYVTSAEEYFKGLTGREAEATTGFKDGIAIPHCKNETVIKPGMFLVKFKNDIEWNTLDGQPVKVAFGLTIPQEGAQEHLKLLSLIARKMIDDEFRNGILSENNPDKLTEIIDEIDF
ncbi:PTS sugar transporter subunit IIA [Vagococcus salmoninarum]|uniref:PTS cellobiose transporter subunit IIA n=1 Tax=Vagococcus salmoninarum TaxID=2739 RepID=A0A429ZW85_9ENTE|nr:fructose PTS transporter subunit IIA [Vagococcus salmoninarum]RST97906.1 PTS cellobiose transporter subunit IIA [Vagococcus salmoninarum]